jgi:integrase
MAIKLPSHLHRSRSGTLHFRIAIPPDLRHHFASREIYRSLRTASVREAVPAAQALSQAAKRAFQQLRKSDMSEHKKTASGPYGEDWGSFGGTDSPQDEKSFGGVDSHQDGGRLGSRLDLITEIHLDEFMRPKLRLISEPGDTPEDRINAQVEFFQSVGVAGAGGPLTPSQAPKKASLLFSELVQDYRRDRLAKGRWLASSEKEYMPIYQLLIEIVGDLPLNAIDDDVALTYVETLKKLPANMNKIPAYKGKSIEEIIALNPPPRATRTINKSIERISSLFKFATSKPKYELSYNPFSGQSLDESDGQHREPFTFGELVQLFSAEEHANRKYKTAYSYWLPLMGMLTGARLNELCQLYLSDFEIVDGVHCISIQDEEEGQRVKNKSAKRIVPVHDKLIEAGLIRYVDRLRAEGEERLFPTLTCHEKGGYGAIPSKWFSKFKERCGILEKQTKVFHSFRHTFISSLLDDDVPETAIAPIVGHEGKLVTSQVYWNKKDPAKRKPTVEKFQPPPELWRLVPKFEDVTVAKGG